VYYENSEALMTHLQDDHGMDVKVSDVTCPLCVEFTSKDRDVLSLHIARHMEEIALAILPTGVDSDEESADDSTSDATSIEDDEMSQTRRNECPEDSNDTNYPSSPLHYHNPVTAKSGVSLDMQVASHGGHEQVDEILLDKSANVNLQGGEYGNALQAASIEEQPDFRKTCGECHRMFHGMYVILSYAYSSPNDSNSTQPDLPWATYDGI
jgi:hypothetical protein